MKKNNNFKNRFLSATLSIVISSSMVISSAVPVLATTTPSTVSVSAVAPLTLTNILNRIKNVFTPTQSLTDQVTKAINSLLDGNLTSTISQSAINNAQSLLNRIPNSILTNSLKQRLQSSINMSKTANSVLSLLTNNTITQGIVNAAQNLLKMLPETSQTKALREGLQTIIDIGNSYLSLRSTVNRATNVSSTSVNDITSSIDSAYELLNTLPKSKLYNNLRAQIQNLINRADNILSSSDK